MVVIIIRVTIFNFIEQCSEQNSRMHIDIICCVCKESKKKLQVEYNVPAQLLVQEFSVIQLQQLVSDWR